MRWPSKALRATKAAILKSPRLWAAALCATALALFVWPTMWVQHDPMSVSGRKYLVREHRLTGAVERMELAPEFGPWESAPSPAEEPSWIPWGRYRPGAAGDSRRDALPARLPSSVSHRSQVDVGRAAARMPAARREPGPAIPAAARLCNPFVQPPGTPSRRAAMGNSGSPRMRRLGRVSRQSPAIWGAR